MRLSYALFAAATVDSGRHRNNRASIFKVNIRVAAICPFHMGDCHIKNHSPPIRMNANDQSRQPSISPDTASGFASWNLRRSWIAA